MDVIITLIAGVVMIGGALLWQRSVDKKHKPTYDQQLLDDLARARATRVLHRGHWI